ncbi:hypothetical protein BS78_02G308400 [Paspalum vaginatum]|nr:hypothetical protein BS78_02G308400 [Paspalum vaginatum]
MASPIRSRSRLEDMGPKRSLPAALTSSSEIFLRITCPADLARASTACASFRRLIADPTLPPAVPLTTPALLLGFVEREGFQAVEAPRPAALSSGPPISPSTTSLAAERATGIHAASASSSS